MTLSDNIRRAKELSRERRTGTAPDRPSTVGRSLPCVRLGPPTGDTTPCGTCRGTVTNKRFACSVHGSCVLPDCKTCEQYESPVMDRYSEITTRHLLYHVYPRHGSRWRERVLRLRERIDLFNGHRAVAVATDGTTDQTQHVRDALEGTGCEVIEVPNDPTRREVATFLPLFERVARSHGPNDALCYAHAKGVTRPPGATCHRWAGVAESVCWDHWPLVAEQLRDHPVTGPFKKVGAGWSARESRSKWHYSGSFYWIRCAELFRKDWRRIDPFWGGIEPYPSLHFTDTEAGCLFHEGRVPSMNLYNSEYWRTRVEPAVTAFTKMHPVAAPSGTPASRLLNLGCGPHYFPGWWNVDVVRTGTIKPDQVVPAGPRLPFADGTFDRAYLGHVLEHVPWADVGTLLREVRRVVVPGGGVVIVGPDVRKAVLHAVGGGAVERVWETYEDANHYQRNEPGFDWPAARHHWNCYGDRVVRAMTDAEFSNVREVELTANDLGATWPVVDYANPCQCAVAGVT